MAVTLTTRSVGLMVAAALAAGWLGASLTHDRSRPRNRRAARARRDPPAAAPVPRAEKLRERMAEPPLPSRGRNPFVYGARDRRRFAITSCMAMKPPRRAPPPMPLAPPVPIFRLSGIASNTENGVAVLTAIVIDNGSMVFAKAGDKLSNGYSVVRVEEMSVTLVDATGVTQTIRLP